MGVPLKVGIGLAKIDFLVVSLVLTHDLTSVSNHDGLTWEKSFEKEKVQFSHMNMVPFLKNIDLATSG